MPIEFKVDVEDLDIKESQAGFPTTVKTLAEAESLFSDSVDRLHARKKPGTYKVFLYERTKVGEILLKTALVNIL